MTSASTEASHITDLRPYLGASERTTLRMNKGDPNAHARQRRLLLVHGEGPAAALDRGVRGPAEGQPRLGSAAGTARARHAAGPRVPAQGRAAAPAAGPAPVGGGPRLRHLVARPPLRGGAPEDAGDRPRVRPQDRHGGL